MGYCFDFQGVNNNFSLGHKVSCNTKHVIQWNTNIRVRLIVICHNHKMLTKLIQYNSVLTDWLTKYFNITENSLEVQCRALKLHNVVCRAAVDFYEICQYTQGWIFLRDLQDYLIGNLDKFRQSAPGNKVWSVKHLLICPDRLSTIVLRNNLELLKNNLIV